MLLKRKHGKVEEEEDDHIAFVWNVLFTPEHLNLEKGPTWRKVAKTPARDQKSVTNSLSLKE